MATKLKFDVRVLNQTKITYLDGSVSEVWLRFDKDDKSVQTVRADQKTGEGQAAVVQDTDFKDGTVALVTAYGNEADAKNKAAMWLAGGADFHVFNAKSGTITIPKSGGIRKHDDPRLSEVRKKLLAQVDLRLDSTEGVKAAPGKINLFDNSVKQTVGTSCGLLPGVVMRKVGVKGDITNYATEGVRVEAEAMGPPVYVISDGTRLPQPGDIYWLRYDGKPEEDGVSHVGIIMDVDPADGSEWITGDSGQDSGGVRGAKRVHRTMRKQDGTHPFLTGEYGVGMRRIGGWVDLDELVARQKK